MNKRVLVYIILNSVLLFLLWLFSYALNIDLRYLASIYMFIPLIATFIVSKVFKIKFSELGLKINFSKWLILAWILPVVLVFISLGINLLIPNVEYSRIPLGMIKYGIPKELLIEKYSDYPIPPVIRTAIRGLLLGAPISLFFAFGEEIGWRGLLYKELRSKGFWKCSLIIGFLWGIWHTPLILGGHNYPQHPQVGVVLFILLCILMTPIYILIRDKTKSVIAASLFHGTYNSVAVVSIGVVIGGNDLLVGLNGLSGFITFILLNLGIYFYLRNNEQLLIT